MVDIWLLYCFLLKAIMLPLGPVPILAACTTTWGTGDIQTLSLGRTMSGPVLKSTSHIATKSHTKTQGWNCNLRPWCQAATQAPEPSNLSGQCFHPEPGCPSGPRLLPRATSGSVVVCSSAAVGLCHLRGPKEPCEMKSEGRTELALPFADPGKAGLASH